MEKAKPSTHFPTAVLTASGSSGIISALRGHPECVVDKSAAILGSIAQKDKEKEKIILGRPPNPNPRSAH
jgi:hypothetical protein